MFRRWEIGDLVEDDAFDGTTSYNTIEAFETSDRVNKSDLNRPLRNLFENVDDLHQFLENFLDQQTIGDGIAKSSLDTAFLFLGDSDIFNITVNPGTGDTTQYYARLAPGALLFNKHITINIPQTHIAERQLNEILSLASYGEEGVEIKYYYTTDKFQARIKRNNINGTTVTYEYLNGGSWGDSTLGFNSGMQLLEAIYGDSINVAKEMFASIGTDLTKITLEPTIWVEAGDIYFWKINSAGIIVGDTYAASGDSQMNIFHFTIAVGGDSATEVVDYREFLQNKNDFGQNIFLNVPLQFGDTDTSLVTNPLADIVLPYSFITNQNSFLVFLRKSAGDTMDNSVFGWSEDTIPGISVTRSGKFFANKDILSQWSGGGGDTLGASWASLAELSGDSWDFYGNKYFRNGFFKIDSNNTDADAVKIDTTGGMDIDVDAGFTLDENSGAYLRIDTDGQVSILSPNGQDIIISSGDSIDINADGGITLSENSGSSIVMDTDGAIIISPAAGQDVSFIGDSFVVNTTYDSVINSVNFNIASTGNINFDTTGYWLLNTDAGFTMRENSGCSVDVDTDGRFRIVTPTDQNIEFTSLGDIDITADGDTITLTSSSIYSVTSDITLTTALATLEATEQVIIRSASATYGDSAILLSATNAAGGIRMVALADILMTTSDGIITIGDSGNIGLTSKSGEHIFLTSGGNINLDAAGDTIIMSSYDMNIASAVDIDGAFFEVATTGSGASSVKIDTLGGLDIDTDAGITLDENSGAYLRIDTNGIVSLYSASNQDLNIYAQGSGNMFLNADGDSILLTAIDIGLVGRVATTGNITIGENVNAEIGDTVVVSTFVGTPTDEGVFCRGSFAAYKIYNAVFNDYAEGFEFDLMAGKPEPGLVYIQTDRGLVKSYKKSDKATIGVYSDTAAMILGSDGLVTEINAEGNKIPIGLAGKVKVWVNEKLEIGDKLVSGKNGFAKKANLFDRIFSRNILGKVLEPSCCKNKKRVWMLIGA